MSIRSGETLNLLRRMCAVCVVCGATAISLRAQTFTSLFSFKDSPGAYPEAPLVQATDGNLYGTTEYGGPYGYGTIFKITPSGTVTTVYRFCKRDICTDGEYPIAGLVQATDGNLYGTTGYGGPYGDNYIGGTVFRITPSRELTTLYSFCSQLNCTDGDLPYGTLIQGTDGNFYGTTFGGGVYNYGSVFKITPSGELTTLYSFCVQAGCTDGDAPFEGLIQATDGNFYGTTLYGGAKGQGTVFKMTPGGVLTSLHSFAGYPKEGAYPYALVQASDGNFYGTTESGGHVVSGGTVFKITPSGTLTTLYDFCSTNCSDGLYPVGALVQATDGNFYGTTTEGGTTGGGTIFQITSAGSLTTLYGLCSQGYPCVDGYYPTAGLVQATNGTFYGTSYYGGTSGNCGGGCGTVFSENTGLGAFVETLPTSGSVGTPVKILGTDLTGVTGVTFNGTAASFNVVSPSEITTTVPSGATTGTVQVITPGGTLSSNVPFRVTP